MKYFITSFLWIMVLFVQAQKPQTTADFYTNPVISGMSADPSICKAGDDYYLVNSSFLWFPGVPIYHSKDLINWELIGHVLDRRSQLDLTKGGGIFAATIRFYRDTFYVVTTNRRNGGNFFVKAINPAGPWSDPVWIDQDGADPSLFFENDKTYFTSCISGAILQSEINIKTGKIISDKKIIWRGTGGRDPEGPHLYKYKEFYYLMIAEGGTDYGHKITIARSSSPWGPFESYAANPILTQNKFSSQANPLQGAGHGDIIQATDGSWWMVFLAFRPFKGHHHLERETCLTPMNWNDAGWPAIPFEGTAMTENHTKTLPLYPFAMPASKDDFNNEKLSSIWNFYCNPVPGSWSLTERKGFLRLYGLKGNMDTSRSPQMILQTQKYFECAASTNIDFDPVNENEEAGLTVFYSQGAHYDLYIRKKGNNREVVLRYVLGKIIHEEKTMILSKGNVQLKVEANKASYVFSFSKGTENLMMGEVDTKFLSPETFGGFLGLHIGMFAAGNNMNSRTAADFDWFEMKPL